MKPLLDAARMGRLDRYAMDTVGLPGALLMETAGRGVFAAIEENFRELMPSGNFAVVAGRGNNGGDGFVAARCMAGAGLKVIAFLLGKKGEVKGDARLHLEAYLASGGMLVECSENDGIPEEALRLDLIVDAIFGTGLNREVDPFSGLWIEHINSSGAHVVAVDLPSGVCADSGRILGEAARAEITVTFGHLKKGHFLGPGAALAGRVVLKDIGIPPHALPLVKPDLYLVEECDLAGHFTRSPDAHKGHFGHLGVVAGGRGKMGAAALAAWAPLKVGAGLSTALFPAGLLTESRFPMEAMTEPLGSGSPGPLSWSPALLEAARDALTPCDAVVVGPGMGTLREVEEFLGLLLSIKERPPLLLDADALTILAHRPEWKRRLAPEDVITPHPGEAARLLGTDNAGIQADRQKAALDLARSYKCVVALKGAGTLIAARGESSRLVARGNPGMATAGSGDVLAGVVGAFMARGLPSFEAATAGVWVHAVAGDLAALRNGQEGLTAGDILLELPAAMKSFTHG